MTESLSFIAGLALRVAFLLLVYHGAIAMVDEVFTPIVGEVESLMNQLTPP